MKFLLILIFAVSFIGIILAPNTFAVTGEGGTAFVEKPIYGVTKYENTLVKIFGIVENPRGGNWVFATMTYPNGIIVDLQTPRSTQGPYEIFTFVDYDNLGKYSVDIRFESKNIGIVTFEVVDKYAKSTESVVEPEIETKPLANFVDPNLEPKYYVERYTLEPNYMSWFDTNYPEYSIWEAIGITETEYLKLVKEISGGPESVIPNWIKNNAGWWAEGQIDNFAFLLGIQYLINEGIIIIPPTEDTAESVTEQTIPAWVKNNAGWWAEGQIDDSSFLYGIQYLIKSGIITVS